MFFGKIKKIKYKVDKKNLSTFLRTAGASLDTFRYFQKRNLNVVESHLFTILYFIKTEPIGYGHIDYENEKHWLGICVSEAYRGKGIGKEIITYLIEESKKYNLRKIYLSVDENNFSAIVLYEKIGFVFFEKHNNINYYEIII